MHDYAAKEFCFATVSAIVLVYNEQCAVNSARRKVDMRVHDIGEGLIQ